MKNKLQLTAKVSNKVSLKNTLVFASIGVGVFIILFTAAFFYLNLGNSEKSLAATVITANSGGGNWSASGTWDLNRKTQDNDEIVVPAGVTVTIDANSTLNNVIIKVYGTLRFTNGKLRMDEMSQVLIASSGNLVSDGPGNSDQLQIGSQTWKGGQIDAVMSPSQLTKDGENSSNLLPIVLDYFKAEATPSNSILITWGTVTEKENDFFTLEKSVDGKTFETITTVTGAGNSQKKLSYSFEDKNVLAGMNYYRLKQTDFNGDFEYFKIVGVNNPTASTSKSISTESIVVDKVWPNPFKDDVNLSFTAESAGDVEVLIQNSTGVIIHKEIIPAYQGDNTYQFSDASQLKPGVYFINLWSNGKKFKPQRIIKM